MGNLLFKKGGEFVLSEEKKLQFLALDKYEKFTHIVYAHFVDGKVFYIGESSNTFRDRMRLYITHDGKTNIMVRGAVKKYLINGCRVETFVFKPHHVVVNGTLLVNPYVGVEQALIKMYKKHLINKKDVA